MRCNELIGVIVAQRRLYQYLDGIKSATKKNENPVEVVTFSEEMYQNRQLSAFTLPWHFPRDEFK